MAIKYFIERGDKWNRVSTVAKLDVRDDACAYTIYGAFCSVEHLEEEWIEISDRQFEAIVSLIEDVQQREKEIAEATTLQNKAVGVLADVMVGVSSGEMLFFDRGNQSVKERDFGFRIIQ